VVVVAAGAWLTGQTFFLRSLPQLEQLHRRDIVKGYKV
jgi:hypothetical protein